MRLSHDDQMRQARLRLATTPAAPVALDPPVQLTRTMINRASAITTVHLVAPNTMRRYRLADGAIREFVRTARAVQNLPSFGKGLRS